MEFVELLKEAELLDFGQNFNIARPELSGDRLFPDQKTQNITAKYLAMSDSAYLPTMATVHALDAEAQIGSRPTASIVTVEKLLIKRKINLSERVRLLRSHGVSTNNEILDYIFDDMARLAEGVKTRTEVAKQELLATGKMTINENHVNTTIDFGVPTDHTNKTFDWSTEAKAKTILDDIQGVRDAAIATGRVLREIVTSSAVLSLLAKSAVIQNALFGSGNSGRNYEPVLPSVRHRAHHCKRSGLQLRKGRRHADHSALLPEEQDCVPRNHGKRFVRRWSVGRNSGRGSTGRIYCCIAEPVHHHDPVADPRPGCNLD